MAELHVSKKNLIQLFGNMQNKQFIIPDFQRPYKWDTERCETLWNDIENFMQTEGQQGSDYFLGTIVSYANEQKNQEIIDGQQRITSLFLLLRAFYRKLENMIEDQDVRGLKNQIAPCIWDINPISQQVSDKSKIHIKSLVATEDDNEIFHDLLSTGDCSEEAKDNYSINYRFFKKQCDKYATDNPMQWKELCITILQKCIVLPIECDTPETALTIFSTLNDRGLPLADSDIFKAQIYRHLATPTERKAFSETWKELTQTCKKAGITIDDVFRYYTHTLRAIDGDKSKEMGLRKFYAENKYSRLHAPDLMDNLKTLADFWFYINTNTEPDEEAGYDIYVEARKYLHCLSHYPNEYWKYAVSVFFLKHKNDASFAVLFSDFLKKIVAFFFVKFINAPTVNAVRDDTYAICISIEANQLKIPNNTTDSFDIQKTVSSKIARPLLLLHAYLHPNQTGLIANNFEIEHIFPRKWQDTNYNGWSNQSAQEYLDKFGNKIIFEKKLNIQAGNGYFNTKKQKYRSSTIACVKELSNYPKADWLQQDIEAREHAFIAKLLEFFTSPERF